VNGQRSDARLLGKPCNTGCITGLWTPAGTNLEGHRYLYSRSHGLQNIPYQRLITQQGRSRCLVAYLLGRTAHVDIDDLGTVGDI
jgi:hypothetical protein